MEGGIDYVTSEGFANMINGLSQSKKPLLEILHSLTDTKYADWNLELDEFR